jgi:hypothetical protein
MIFLITAEKIRPPFLTIVALLVLAIIVDGLFFKVAIQSFKNNGFSGIILMLAAVGLIFPGWLAVESCAYFATKDVQFNLDSKKLELSIGRNPIPISAIRARIGDAEVMVPDQINNHVLGRGLIIEVQGLNEFLDLNFIDRRNAIFGTKDKIQLLIGKQISEEDAHKFLGLVNPAR